MELPDLWSMFGTGTDKQRLAKGVTVPGFGRQNWCGHQGRGVKLIWPQFSGDNNYLATVEPGEQEGEVRATYYPGYPKGTRKNKRPEPRVRSFPEADDRTLVRNVRKWVQKQIDMDPVAQALKMRDAWDLPQSPGRNGLALVHSPSAVRLYEDCPHKYMRIRVKKDVEDKIGPAGERGIHVHALLRSLIEGEERHLQVDIDRKASVVDKEFYEIMKMVKRGSDIADEMKRKEYRVQAELQVGLDRNLEAADFSSPQVWMRGVIDMLALGKSEAWIVDWKTGKWRFERFQADVYAMAVFARFPDVQRITFTYEWLKTGEKDRFYYTRDEMTGLSRMLIGATKPIEQDETWKKTPGPLCQWCPVWDCQHNEIQDWSGSRSRADPGGSTDYAWEPEGRTIVWWLIVITIIIILGVAA